MSLLPPLPHEAAQEPCPLCIQPVAYTVTGGTRSSVHVQWQGCHAAPMLSSQLVVP